MAELLKDMIDDIESKNPYVIVEEMGTGYVPTLLPGHLFAFSVNLPYVVNESSLPLNRFQYQEEKDDGLFLSEEPYFDEMPIGLCLKTRNPNSVKILNFSVIPPGYRYKILETYYQRMKPAIHVGYEEDLSTEKMTMLERLKENNYIAPFMAVDTRFIQQITGINLKFAINKYRINTLHEVKLLDWNTLPSMVKMNVSEKGMTFNPGAGGLEGMFNTFISRM